MAVLPCSPGDVPVANVDQDDRNLHGDTTKGVSVQNHVEASGQRASIDGSARALSDPDCGFRTCEMASLGGPVGLDAAKAICQLHLCLSLADRGDDRFKLQAFTGQDTL